MGSQKWGQKWGHAEMGSGLTFGYFCYHESMARKPRIHYPGAVYHVILRGNDGQDIFFNASDRSRFCLLLQEGVERYEHRIHAFCLMTNHVHLVIQVGDVRLSRIMQNLCFRETENLTMTALGHYLRRDISSLSQAANRLGSRAALNTTLAEKLVTIRKKLIRIPKCQA